MKLYEDVFGGVVDYFVTTSDVMGTFLSVTCYGERVSGQVSAVQEYFRYVERLCSRFLPDSEISSISQKAGQAAVEVSPVVRDILEEALFVAKFTKGVFDPTMGAVTSLWDIGCEDVRVPSETEQKKAFSLVDYHKLTVKGLSAFLQDRGMVLDVGGVAKEFALRHAADLAEGAGETMLINAGGDVATVGHKVDGSPWRVGIQHPRKRHTLVATVTLSDRNMVETSGDYRRFLLRDGLFQSHIFQKDSSCTPLVSATLVYNRKEKQIPFNGAACIAGGLASVKSWLELCPAVEGIFITADLTVYVTEGIASLVKVLDSDVRRKALILHNR